MILTTGKTHGGSHLRRSNFPDDCHELVPRVHDSQLLSFNTGGYGYISRFVSHGRVNFSSETRRNSHRVLLDNSSPSWSSQLGDQPVYRLNSTESCSGGMTCEYSSFRTVTKLVASKRYLRLQSIKSQSTFQSYPFDMYAFFFQ
jgi:hypothetical protein